MQRAGRESLLCALRGHEGECECVVPNIDIVFSPRSGGKNSECYVIVELLFYLV